MNLFIKKWIYPKFVEEIYKKYQPTHPGGLNTLKKEFWQKKIFRTAEKI